MKTRLLLLSMVCSFAYSASAAPPVVSGITASQRANTKIVDVTYNLTLDAGQKAFVELWFSPDNGLTFPIRCVDVSGEVDSNVTAGNSKTVEWNAESDWNQQFTAHGKIRVIATYGDEPSGFSGSGNAGSGNNGGAHADESLVAIPWDVLWIPNGAGAGYSNQTQVNENWNTGEIMFTKINVDPEEITNEKWNIIAGWARDNGYPGLPDAPANAVEDEPRTGITFWEALKWCNARSERDGLEPAYYIDATEAIGDLNGDGAITAGTDVFDPNPALNQDTNGNYRWDQGEPFTDNPPQTGTYEPQEYVDVNGNGQFDEGLSTVFRAGANVAGFGTQLSAPGIPQPSVPGSPIKEDASGYRLPYGFVSKKLATGGNHQKKWPWGDDKPPGFGAPEYGQFSDYVLAGNANDPANAPTKPTSASNRQANGYGLKDLIGNVAEFTEDAWEQNIGGTQQVVAYVYGGSYLALEWADEGGGGARVFTKPGGGAIANLFNLDLEGPASDTSPAIGFRCVTYE